eukprot:scaffold73363_cov60-Phaeocystis_antarctica.AAC.3
MAATAPPHARSFSTNPQPFRCPRALGFAIFMPARDSGHKWHSEPGQGRCTSHHLGCRPQATG